MSETFTQGDIGTTLTMTVNANLTGGTLEAHIRRPDGTVFNKTPVATDAPGGVCVVTWVAGDLAQAGNHEAELEVTYSASQEQTFGPQKFHVQPQIA